MSHLWFDGRFLRYGNHHKICEVEDGVLVFIERGRCGAEKPKFRVTLDELKRAIQTRGLQSEKEDAIMTTEAPVPIVS